MTISEFSKKHGIPVRTARRAAIRGWIPARKTESGRWEVTEEVSSLKVRFFCDIRRDGKVFDVRNVERFQITSRYSKTFSTNAAADEFERLASN